MVGADSSVEHVNRNATPSSCVTVSVIKRETALIDPIQRDGYRTCSHDGPGTVGCEAVIASTGHRWLRAPQARLRGVRAPQNRRRHDAVDGAEREKWGIATSTHDSTGLSSHYLGRCSELPSAEQALQSFVR